MTWKYGKEPQQGAHESHWKMSQRACLFRMVLVMNLALYHLYGTGDYRGRPRGRETRVYSTGVAWVPRMGRYYARRVQPPPLDLTGLCWTQSSEDPQSQNTNVKYHVMLWISGAHKAQEHNRHPGSTDGRWRKLGQMGPHQTKMGTEGMCWKWDW